MRTAATAKRRWLNLLLQVRATIGIVALLPALVIGRVGVCLVVIGDKWGRGVNRFVHWV